MPSTDPKSLTDYFKQGLKARQDGLTLKDNPYSAGSDKRREWSAGFCATLEAQEDDDAAVGFEPGACGDRRPPD